MAKSRWHHRASVDRALVTGRASLITIVLSLSAALASALPAHAAPVPRVAFGAYTTGAPAASAITDLGASVGRTPAVVNWYRDWTSRAFASGDLQAVAAVGA